MEIPLPPTLQPTNEMLTLIAAIDEFKGEWRALGNLGPAADWEPWLLFLLSRNIEETGFPESCRFPHASVAA
jgi:hypothetical protein